MVKIIAIIKLVQKFKPAFNRKGKDIKSISEGITIQKILLDRLLICSISLDSRYIHIKDKTEIIGTDAIKLPKKLLFFETSEIKAIINEDINNLNRKYFIFVYFPIT